MSIQQAIDNSYIAQGLSEAELRKLHALATERHYREGETILRQNDATRDLFILLRGRALVQAMTGETIGVVTAGMPIGEISFLDGKPRSVSVISDSKVTVAHLEGEALLALLQQNPSIANTFLWNVSRVLCARLRSADNNIAALLAIEESGAQYTKT